MTLTELRYIVAVAQEKHFGRAAQRCHVSQPTLSIAIKKLEEELALSLFDRSSNEVITTEAGERIVAALVAGRRTLVWGGERWLIGLHRVAPWLAEGALMRLRGWFVW